MSDLDRAKKSARASRDNLLIHQMPTCSSRYVQSRLGSSNRYCSHTHSKTFTPANKPVLVAVVSSMYGALLLDLELETTGREMVS
jgi:hypothetical protein